MVGCITFIVQYLSSSQVFVQFRQYQIMYSSISVDVITAGALAQVTEGLIGLLLMIYEALHHWASMYYNHALYSDQTAYSAQDSTKIPGD